MTNKEKQWFPCPVCLRSLDVRTSKTNKPYVICSPCGVQIFIRERAGIEAFEDLVEQGRKENVLARVAELERRYRLKCPDCGKSFWLDPKRIVSNRITGQVTACRCPQMNCQAAVPLGEPGRSAEQKNEDRPHGSIGSSLATLVK